jgi:translation initiation factor 6
LTIEQLDISGNSFIGVYCRANEELLLHPPGVGKRIVRRMAQALEVDARKMTVGGSTLVGSLVAMNSTGAVVSNFVEKEELKALGDMNIVKAPVKLNACGNNILCNDRAAFVNPGYTKKLVKNIANTLGVEVVRGTIAGIRTVGSAAVAVNKGIMCHPKSSKEDLKALRDLFKVNVQIGTANYGSAMVGACLVANTKGAVVGMSSTGIELGRVEDALGYLD